MLDRHPTNIRAVVKIDGQIKTVSFVRLDDGLLIDEITQEDGGRTTSRLRYSDYGLMGAGWIPGSVEHSQHGPGGTRFQTYLNISLSPASDPSDLGGKFLVPQPGESDFGDAYVVRVLSGETALDFSGRGGRLRQLNRVERMGSSNR